MNRMSRLLPTPGRFAALVILVLLVLFVVLYLLAPLARLYADKNDELQALQQQLSRFEYLLANEARINAELKRINDLGSEGDLFLRGSKKSIASANLREFINEAVKRSGGQLVSSQEYDADSIESATAIGLRLQVSGDAQNLVDLLYELESARPIIFIDDLAIASVSSRARATRSRFNRGPAQPQHSNSLNIRLDVAGYLAGEAR